MEEFENMTQREIIVEEERERESSEENDRLREGILELRRFKWVPRSRFALMFAFKDVASL